MPEKINAANALITGATPAISMFAPAVIIGLIVYVTVYIFRKNEKPSKKSQQQNEAVAKIAGLLTFIGVMFITTNNTSKTLIAPKTENIEVSETGAWVAIAIILITIIATIFLTYRRHIFTPKISKKPTARYEPTISSQNKPINEWDLKLLKSIEWRRFEYLCEAIFQELGLRTETIPFGPDGGIDIKIYNEGSIHPDAIVQCKAWNNRQVGIKEMRELLGVMTDLKVKEGIFMTTNEYHHDTITFAKNNNIDLRSGKEILTLINQLPTDAKQRIFEIATEGDYKTPTCASCGIKMVRRKEFWGCKNYPRCKTTIRYAKNSPSA